MEPAYFEKIELMPIHAVLRPIKLMIVFKKMLSIVVSPFVCRPVVVGFWRRFMILACNCHMSPPWNKCNRV